MKNQTTGRARYGIVPAITDDIFPWWPDKIYYAAKNYRNGRQNGEASDAPPRNFPQDGRIEWQPGSFFSYAIYKEGRGDHLWMAECDRNYITRLERDGCQTATEKQDLETWQADHKQEYARGPQRQSGDSDDPEKVRGDFVRAHYERKAQEAQAAAAKAEEEDYQGVLDSYLNRNDELAILEAVKGRASCQLITELSRLKASSIDASDSSGRTALHLAVEENNVELVKTLVDAGASCIAQDGLGKTPKDLAFSANLIEIGQILQLAEKNKNHSPSNSSKSSGSSNAYSATGLESWHIPLSELQWTPEDRSTRLGMGASGLIYKGHYSQAHDVVAIKTLSGVRASRMPSDALKQEAAIMTYLHSDYVVRFYGLCERENAPTLLVMEYCPGGSLYDYLHPQDTQSELTWTTRYSLGHDISRGLDYLHRHHPSILHCDLKSLNILLVTNNSGKLQAKLADFGLSRINNESLAQDKDSDSMKGTPAWMAPELLLPNENDQLANHSVYTDIYALGMIFWELATQEKPFWNMTRKQIIDILKEKKRPTIPDNTPSAYSDLISRCWAERARRRPSAEGVMGELNTLLKAELQDPRPEYSKMLFSNNGSLN